MHYYRHIYVIVTPTNFDTSSALCSLWEEEGDKRLKVGACSSEWNSATRDLLSWDEIYCKGSLIETQAATIAPEMQTHCFYVFLICWTKSLDVLRLEQGYIGTRLANQPTPCPRQWWTGESHEHISCEKKLPRKQYRQSRSIENLYKISASIHSTLCYMICYTPKSRPKGTIQNQQDP